MLTAPRHPADPHFPTVQLDRAARLFEKRAVPAAALVVPRSHVSTAVDDHHPDRDEAMFGARSDLEIGRGVERLQPPPGKAAGVRHARSAWPRVACASAPCWHS